jgi:hypothetical protein
VALRWGKLADMLPAVVLGGVFSMIAVAAVVLVMTQGGTLAAPTASCGHFRPAMPGNLSLDALKEAVARGEIDTVLVAAVDMQGRLMGKRFHAAFFVENGWKETHCCNYLLAVDMEMTTVPGYKSAGWEQGYGDYVMKPDLATMRRLPWLPGTALVLADLLDHHTAMTRCRSARAPF